MLSCVVKGIEFNLLGFAFEFSAGMIPLALTLTIALIVPSAVAGICLVVIAGRVNLWFIFFPHD